MDVTYAKKILSSWDKHRALRPLVKNENLYQYVMAEMNCDMPMVLDAMVTVQHVDLDSDRRRNA